MIWIKIYIDTRINRTIYHEDNLSLGHDSSRRGHVCSNKCLMTTQESTRFKQLIKTNNLSRHEDIFNNQGTTVVNWKRQNIPQVILQEMSNTALFQMKVCKTKIGLNWIALWMDLWRCRDVLEDTWVNKIENANKTKQWNQILICLLEWNNENRWSEFQERTENVLIEVELGNLFIKQDSTKQKGCTNKRKTIIGWNLQVLVLEISVHDVKPWKWKWKKMRKFIPTTYDCVYESGVINVQVNDTVEE
jgi:hypothetical protein